MPKLRQLKVASAKMGMASYTVACTTKGERILGKIVCQIMAKLLCPTARKESRIEDKISSKLS